MRTNVCRIFFNVCQCFLNVCLFDVCQCLHDVCQCFVNVCQCVLDFSQCLPDVCSMYCRTTSVGVTSASRRRPWAIATWPTSRTTNGGRSSVGTTSCPRGSSTVRCAWVQTTYSASTNSDSRPMFCSFSSAFIKSSFWHTGQESGQS